MNYTVIPASTETPKYINQYLYSDVKPFEVIKKKSKTILIIRAMKVKPDPDYKPEFVLGGFSAHCTNNGGQKWIIESDENAKEFEIRLKKKRYHKYVNFDTRQELRMYGKYGDYIEADKPIYFYDYNF